MNANLESRFIGGMLGHLAGDALGAPFEALPAESIVGMFGSARKIVETPPVEKLSFTDDTQMSVALAEELCTSPTLDEDRLMHAFATAYDPARGYGTGMRRLLAAARDGEDWRKMALKLFPGGSYGNGAAMRAAPIGLFFHQDLDAVWEQARKSAIVTHLHPLGIEGAQLFALAVALAARGEAGDHDLFYETLRSRATQEEYQWLLKMSSNLTAQDSLGYMGSSLEAHRSVVTAITCFAVSPDSWPGAVTRALALGDDTDTLMGMAGAISGTHLGAHALPDHVLERIENEGKGRDYVRALAERLFAAWSERQPRPAPQN